MTPLQRSNTSYEAVVIGGGFGGLVAAGLLARAGARTLLLEAGSVLGGCIQAWPASAGARAPLLAHTLYALDVRVVKELRLYRRGLSFAQRDMDLVALKPGGRHLILPRHVAQARREIAAFGVSDALAYGSFYRRTRAFARTMRPLWNALIEYIGDEEEFSFPTIVRRLDLSSRDQDHLVQLGRMSAASYLDRWFESDALKAALSFDAGTDGLSPHEPGSALTLHWVYAQESCGRQAAVSQPRHGSASLIKALEAAARHYGAELRTDAPVASILIEHGNAVGVALADGRAYHSDVVLSSLDARRTLLDLVPPGAIGFGAAASLPPPGKVASAKLIVALNGPPPFAGLASKHLKSRFVVADRPESAAEAKGAALGGHVPAGLVFELTVPTAADPELALKGQHLVSALLRYLPVHPGKSWESCRATLKERALASLEQYAPGFQERIVAAELIVPDDIALACGASPAQPAMPPTELLTSYASRVSTPIRGLYLCGSGAEPVGAISGRAARVAAAHAFAIVDAARRSAS